MASSLNRHGLGMIIGLAVQYLLGMSINLFEQFPLHQGASQDWRFATHSVLIMFHLVLGTLLVIGAIALVVRAFKAVDIIWKQAEVAGLISLLIAWGAGDSFVTTQASGLSYLMSLGFLLAIASYAWGLYRHKTANSRS